MGFLKVIDLHHLEEPHFAERGLRPTFFVGGPSQVLRLEAGDPAIDSRPRQVQKPADTDKVGYPNQGWQEPCVRQAGLRRHLQEG